MEKCQGCSALVPVMSGPTHAYMTCVPGCWHIYSEVLAREYSNKDYALAHRLTVDAYALQHPGDHEQRAIQSVNAHLTTLYCIFEKGMDLNDATDVIGTVVSHHKKDFIYLKPPKSLGPLTIVDVSAAHTPEMHRKVVYDWAHQIYMAWAPHHKTVANWV